MGFLPKRQPELNRKVSFVEGMIVALVRQAGRYRQKLNMTRSQSFSQKNTINLLDILEYLLKCGILENYASLW